MRGHLSRLLVSRSGPVAAGGPWVRWISGTVFLVFGLGKFVAHAAEAESFGSYGLPAPATFAYAIGTLEVGAGLLLIAGALTRLVALAMAANMTAAIALSGIGQCEVVPSLTLAPVLLVSMAYLLWAGAGDHSADTRITGAQQPQRR